MKTKEELLNLISDVVDGEIQHVKLDYPLSINEITDYLKETHNLEDTDEFDSNGWQWDYWLYFEGEREDTVYQEQDGQLTKYFQKKTNGTYKRTKEK